jgi:hypothetical protein
MNRLLSSPYSAPSLLLVFVCLAAFAIGLYSMQLAERGRTEAEQQQRALGAARTRFQGAGQERELLTRYVPEYRALADFGFIGAEQRANWIDGLRNAGEATRLPGVLYQIGAQAPYPMPAQQQAALTQSTMKIELRLLHEGDLMRFLRALAAERAGVFTVNECTLERTGAGGSAGGGALSLEPGLRAQCELAWISAAKPPGAAR